MAILTVQGPEIGECEVVIQKGLMTIGRHESNVLCLPDNTVSRFHCEIENKGHEYLIRDLQSHNGVLLNRKAVFESTLQESDTIEIGAYRLTFHEKADLQWEMDDLDDIDLSPEEDGAFSENDIKAIVPSTSQGITEKDIDDIVSSTHHKRVDVLKIYLKLSDIVHKHLSPEEFLKEALVVIGDFVHYERGVIVCYNEKEHRWIPQASHYRNDMKKKGKMPVSRSVLEKCRNERSGVLSEDASLDRRFLAAESIMNQGIHSVVCAPFEFGNDEIGVIYLDSCSPVIKFTEDDLVFLLAAANEIKAAMTRLRGEEVRQDSMNMALIGRTMTAISRRLQNFLFIRESTDSLIDEALETDSMDQIKIAWELHKNQMTTFSVLLNDMILYSRDSSSEFKSVNPNHIVIDVCDSFQNRCRREGIRFEFDLEENSAECSMDREGLHRALDLLLFALSEKMKQQKEKVILLSTQRSGVGNLFHISLTHTAPQIDWEKETSLLKPDSSQVGKDEWGLGLVLVRKIVEDHKGHVQISPDGRNITLAFQMEMQ